MYVDASAIVAIILHEPEARDSAERLSRARKPVTSGLSIWEACAAVRRELKTDGAYLIVSRFLAEAGIATVPIGDAETRQAWGAFQEYGRQTDHPAQLNMGDCFSLACADVHGDHVLLFKGNDFIHTPLGQG